VLLNGPGTFFAALFWVDCITNTAGSDMRQAQSIKSWHLAPRQEISALL
jgi:hypothetical protein